MNYPTVTPNVWKIIMQVRKIWADKVAEKYTTATSVGSNLEATEENWFIKYDLKLNK